MPMLRCREVVDLVGSDMLAAQPLQVRVGVHLHLAMCRHCSAYARGLYRLRRLASGMLRQTSGTISQKREDLLTALRAAITDEVG